MSNTDCASVVFLKKARETTQTVEFWKRNWGFFLWASFGFLCVIAGLFQPIESLEVLYISGTIVLSLVGFVLSGSSGDAAGFCLVCGFGGFLLAMYGVGFALGSLAFGWVLIALLIAILLYGVGVIAIQSIA